MGIFLISAAFPPRTPAFSATSRHELAEALNGAMASLGALTPLLPEVLSSSLRFLCAPPLRRRSSLESL